MSELSRHLLEPGDLEDEEIEFVLQRSQELSAGARPRASGSQRTMALLFLASSLRTRLGFAAAGARLGLIPIDIAELRWEPGMSHPESFGDTVRVVSSMVDVVVGRTPFELDRGELARECQTHYVNGGDGWNHHPTQALIDLFAIESACGPIDELHIAIMGDLRMHVSRSLVDVLERRVPRRLSLISPPGRSDLGFNIRDPLASRTTRSTSSDLAGVDAVYLAGLPEGTGGDALDRQQRRRYAVDAHALSQLSPSARVFCPLPAIDEIDPDVRRSPSVFAYRQAELGLYVRMAILEMLLAQ